MTLINVIGHKIWSSKMGKYRNSVAISRYQWRHACFALFTEEVTFDFSAYRSFKTKWNRLARCISKNDISCLAFVYGCVPTSVLPLRERQKVRTNVATIVIVQTRIPYAVARVPLGNVEQRMNALGYSVSLPLNVTTAKCGAVTIIVPLRHAFCLSGPSYW